MQDYKLIQTENGVASLAVYLRDTGCVRAAVDIEGENNLHSYGIRVSLIQIFDGKRAYAIDVLALASSAALRPLLQESSWVKVVYDAANDLLAFQHDLGLSPTPILDVAVAAHLLRKPGGLSALSPAGRSRSSKDKYQRANWMRRPLPPDLLEYAISDVLGLLDIADTLLAELVEKKLIMEFLCKNWERQSAVRTWDPLSNYTRIPGYHRLKPEGRRLARVLWYAREYYARRFDLSPEMVASKQLMRRIIEENAADAAAMVRLLNENRKREPVRLGEFESCLNEARRDAPTHDVPAQDRRAYDAPDPAV
jgi:ribonuclease D